MDELKNNNILIDLDSLLDTRLALASLMDPEGVSEIYTNGTYHKRKKDNYNRISHDVFLPLYKLRSKQILNFAIPTLLLSLVKEHYVDLATNIKNIDTNKPTIYVNTYPYNLNAMEQNELISLVYSRVGDVDVKTIHMSKEDLDPSWIKENIKTIFSYSGIEWLEWHTAKTNVFKAPMIDVMLIVPAIFNGSVKSEDITKDYLNKILLSFSTLIDLVMVEAKYFSAVQIKK